MFDPVFAEGKDKNHETSTIHSQALSMESKCDANSNMPEQLSAYSGLPVTLAANLT